MPNPTFAEIHPVDTPLTDISVAWAQNPANFVNRQVFPVVGSQYQTGRYFVWDKDDFRRTDAALRAPGTYGATRNLRLATDTYACDVYSIGMNVSAQDRANALDPLDLESSFTTAMAQDVSIREEVNFAAAAFVTGVWGTSTTPGTTWDDAASTPIEDIATGIETILENTGFKPNTLLLGANTWYSGLLHHPDVIARLPDTSARIVTGQQLAAILGIDRVVVSMASYNTAAEELTASESLVLGKHALLCYVNPNPSLNTPSAGYTFTWQGFAGNPQGIMTTRYDVPEEDAYPRIETFTAVDFKIVSTALGYAFISVVA
jgi:hypothetical protein